MSINRNVRITVGASDFCLIVSRHMFSGQLPAIEQSQFSITSFYNKKLLKYLIIKFIEEVVRSLSIQ